MVYVGQAVAARSGPLYEWLDLHVAVACSQPA